MVFTTEHKLVKDYALLIQHNKKTIDDVPDVGNLREMVLSVLNA